MTKKAAKPAGYFKFSDRAKAHMIRSDFFGMRETFYTEKDAFEFGFALMRDKAILIGIRKSGLLTDTTNFKTRISSPADWRVIKKEKLHSRVMAKLEYLKDEKRTASLDEVTLAKATQLVIDGRLQGNVFKHRKVYLGPIVSALNCYHFWRDSSCLSEVPVREITADMMQRAIDDEVKTMRVKRDRPQYNVKAGDLIGVSTIGTYQRALMGILKNYKQKYDRDLVLVARGGGMEIEEHDKQSIEERATPKLTVEECHLMIGLGDAEDARRNAAGADEWALFGAFLRVMYCTGIRRKFMSELTWGQIFDLDEGDMPYIRKRMKSGVLATVPLLPMAVNALRVIRRQGYDRPADFVFPNANEKIFKRVSVVFSPMVRKELIETGLVQHTPNPFHSLRAARATWLVRVCGFGIPEVMEWLNCSPATAQRYVDPEALIERKKTILEIAKRHAAEEVDIPMPLHAVGTA